MKRILSTILIAVLLLGLMSAGAISASATEPVYYENPDRSVLCEQYGHRWGFAMPEIVEIVDSTCTEDGYVDRICMNCGTKYRNIFDAQGHHFYEGQCTRCDLTLAKLTKITVQDVTVYDVLDNYDWVWDAEEESAPSLAINTPLCHGLSSKSASRTTCGNFIGTSGFR